MLAVVVANAAEPQKLPIPYGWTAIEANAPTVVVPNDAEDEPVEDEDITELWPVPEEPEAEPLFAVKDEDEKAAASHQWDECLLPKDEAVADVGVAED